MNAVADPGGGLTTDARPLKLDRLYYFFITYFVSECFKIGYIKAQRALKTPRASRALGVGQLDHLPKGTSRFRVIERMCVQTSHIIFCAPPK